MRGWALFYDDGSVVTSDDCAPEDVPGYGVLAIAQPDKRQGDDVANVGWVTLSGDYYYWRSDSREWFRCQHEADVWDLLLHREPIVGICKGRYVPYALWSEVWKRAQAWAEAKGLPEKRYYVVGERGP